jgi:hypothetical protein
MFYLGNDAFTSKAYQHRFEGNDYWMKQRMVIQLSQAASSAVAGANG